MRDKEFSLAVDVGTSKTVAFLISGEEEIYVGVAPSQGMNMGKIVDLETQAVSIKEAVERISSPSLPDSLTLGISGEVFHVRKETTTLEIDSSDVEITEKEIKKVLSMAGEKAKRGSGWEVIHTIPLTYQVGEVSGVVNPLYMEGKNLDTEAMVILTLSTTLDNFIRCVNRAGFKVDRIVFSPYPQSMYIPHEEEKNLGVAVIDIGEGTIEISVFREGKIEEIKVLPRGGKELTRMLAARLRLTLSEAERIKKEEGVCLRYLSEHRPIKAKGLRKEVTFSQWEVAEILEEGVEKMLRELSVILRPYLAHLSAGFILTGGSSNLKGIDEFFEEFFNLPVRVSHPPVTVLPSLPEYSSAWALMEFVRREGPDSYSLPSPFLKPFHILLNWIKEKI
ncbi:MAG: cell division protein FtsA [Caldiserica bacterium]|nr:cell division protein FtsA [Caldisericota bacterium]